MQEVLEFLGKHGNPIPLPKRSTKSGDHYLSWSEKPNSNPFLRLEGTWKTLAAKLTRQIHKYMGDRELSNGETEVSCLRPIFEAIGLGMKLPEEPAARASVLILRDELILQTCKQVNRCPNP